MWNRKRNQIVRILIDFVQIITNVYKLNDDILLRAKGYADQGKHIVKWFVCWGNFGFVNSGYGYWMCVSRLIGLGQRASIIFGGFYSKFRLSQGSQSFECGGLYHVDCKLSRKLRYFFCLILKKEAYALERKKFTKVELIFDEQIIMKV